MEHKTVTTNTELKRLLAGVIAACVGAAGSAESCVYAENPKWSEVAKLLDDCTDDLRELEQTL